MTKNNGMPLEGEGSYIGGKKFQDDERRFVRTGAVGQKSREAADALDGPEAQELEEARERSAKGDTTPRADSAKKAAPQNFVERATLTPDQVFARPELVLSDERLSEDEKRKILEAWQTHETQLLVSTGEGMDQPKPTEESLVPPRASRLPEIQSALRKLGH